MTKEPVGCTLTKCAVCGQAACAGCEPTQTGLCDADDDQWIPEEPVGLPTVQSNSQAQPLEPEAIASNLAATITVKVTHTGQFLVSGTNLKEEIRFHSEWQLAAFFTEMSRHGKLQHLKPFSKSQTYDEWIALGNAVTVIKPEYVPVPKDPQTGLVKLTLEDLES